MAGASLNKNKQSHVFSKTWLRILLSKTTRMNDSGKQAAVTGANGFIGSHLCAALLQQAYYVKALVRSDNNGSSSLIKDLLAAHPGAAETVVGDICDGGSLSSAFDGVDTVFHLAGVAHVGSAGTRSLQQCNVAGTSNVLQAAISSGVKRLVFFSSSLARACELGSGDITEYGKTKLEAERLLLEAHQRGDIDVVILRPANVYGRNMKGNIRSMIAMLARKRLPPLPRLTNALSLVGVEDLVKAAVLAAASPIAAGKTYTVTDGQTYRGNEIERAIYQALGLQRPSWHSPPVLLYAGSALAGLLGKMTGRGSSISVRTYYQLVRDNCFSNQDIVTDLGFAPASNLYEQLPNIVEDIVNEKSTQSVA